MAETSSKPGGRVEGIFICPAKGQPIISVEDVHAVPGRGLDGDRYFNLEVEGDESLHPGHQITLFEMEVIEDLQQKEGIPITPDQTRRNIATRGVILNELVGRDFYVGNIHLLGIRLCEPCQYLADLTDARILQAMLHHGGLRAEIITEGTIRINDPITIPG